MTFASKGYANLCFVFKSRDRFSTDSGDIHWLAWQENTTDNRKNYDLGKECFREKKEMKRHTHEIRILERNLKLN